MSSCSAKHRSRCFYEGVLEIFPEHKNINLQKKGLNEFPQKLFNKKHLIMKFSEMKDIEIVKLLLKKKKNKKEARIRLVLLEDNGEMDFLSENDSI